MQVNISEEGSGGGGGVGGGGGGGRERMGSPGEEWFIQKVTEVRLSHLKTSHATLNKYAFQKTKMLHQCTTVYFNLLQTFHKHEEQMHKQSIFTILTGLLQSHFHCKHNQPSWTFELLHATLQQNDCTNYSFPVTLWSWINIMVIQTGI